MLAATTAVALTRAPVPVLDAAAGIGAARTPATATPSPAPTAPGTCLTWRRTDAGDAAAVPCGRPHRFELAAAVRLDESASAPFPDDAGWRHVVDSRCTPAVASYLHGRLDPDGRFRVGALKPTPRGWTAGDRLLRCGLQSPDAAGALVATEGQVAEVDQARVYPPGTCLSLTGRAVGDPVGCEKPHAAEVAGTADLAKKFTGPAPAVADQDRYLQPTCTTIAADYLGGADKLAASKLTVYWQNLEPASWNVGTHEVSCNLAAQLPDGSGFAPLAGTARGRATIGTTPLPASPSPRVKPGGQPAEPPG